MNGIIVLNSVIFIGVMTSANLCRAGCSIPAPPGTEVDTKYSRSVNVTIEISRDQTPGAIGSPIRLDDGPFNSVVCTSSSYDYGLIRFGNTMLPSSIQDVYETNIPGIGIKIWSENGYGIFPVGNEFKNYWRWVHAYSNYTQLHHIYVQFYVTGSVTPGTVAPTAIVEGWANTQTDTGSGGVKFSTLTINGSVPVTVKSCETPDILVDLKKHSKSDFTSVGSTSAATPFNFEIKKCSKGMAAVKYTFKPASGINLVNPGASNQHVTLRTGSTASGVGVQVLHANDTQVTFNNPITYTGYSASLGGDYVIPMKARYIRTGDVTSGTANSAVEFTMVYE